MLEVYKQLLKNAEEYLSANCWSGLIYSSKTNFQNIFTFEHSRDKYVCRAAADMSIRPKQLFEEITEGTDGAQFFMKLAGGTRIMHNTFKFKCTITEDDGTSREFEGCWRDLKLKSFTSKLSNVKVVK